MDNEKERFIGPVEKKINSLIENTDKEIYDLRNSIEHLPASEKNIIKLNRHVANLNGCILYLAQEIDKLSKPTE
jgi:hypothetical protein